ncbi:MAG: TolC family protein [Saprospiraceae bacterium]|nr:TolC family protein [Saprospiraceae bacterium]
MRASIILMLILLGVKLPGQSLEDLVNIALENNPGLKAKATEVEVVRQRIDQVALPDPQINASLFMNPMMLPMGNQLGSISAMQMFPWFGALDAMEVEVMRMSEVKQQSVLVTRNELIFKVKSAWYPLLELDQIIEIQKENLRILETDKELATSRFQFAKGPMVDVIRTDIMIDELNTEIALMEQKRKPLQVALNRLLNRPENTLILLGPN